MSQSLRPWLFAHVATQAAEALDGGFALADMPFLPGNRVQVLRFLTYRNETVDGIADRSATSSKSKTKSKSKSLDVWALVGDPTHCIAARFCRAQVDRFQSQHGFPFTRLRGALLTLTNLKVTVDRVQVHEEPHVGSSTAKVVSAAGSMPYRKGQYAVILDVRGFDVVSSINEPVWFSHVKVVTSPNSVNLGGAGGLGTSASVLDDNDARILYNKMIQWMKKWIRCKSLLRRARAEHIQRRSHGAEVLGSERKRDQSPNCDAKESVAVAEAGASLASITLPTPAQRRRLDHDTPLHSSFLNRDGAGELRVHFSGLSEHSAAASPVASPSWEACPSQCQPDDAAGDDDSQDLWAGFDLDVPIGEPPATLGEEPIPPSPPSPSTSTCQRQPRNNRKPKNQATRKQAREQALAALMATIVD
ncbi:hypothetical protein BCV70DRAFT_202220 [Testicularia cyperi]|uniref:Telomere replication protein EST3 n=1 Tax=Testicularia cyperi TaxID=1882483 RepID=A0A317XIX8_9BASI|nr:hypothetical protein BCV70DRAFT_202220 [Testicularia cyperi]